MLDETNLQMCMIKIQQLIWNYSWVLRKVHSTTKDGKQFHYQRKVCDGNNHLNNIWTLDRLKPSFLKRDPEWDTGWIEKLNTRVQRKYMYMLSPKKLEKLKLLIYLPKPGWVLFARSLDGIEPHPAQIQNLAHQTMRMSSRQQQTYKTGRYKMHKKFSKEHTTADAKQFPIHG